MRYRENESDQDCGHGDERVIAHHTHTEIKPVSEVIHDLVYVHRLSPLRDGCQDVLARWSLWSAIHFARSLLQKHHCVPTLKAGNSLIMARRATVRGYSRSNLAVSWRVRTSSSIPYMVKERNIESHISYGQRGLSFGYMNCSSILKFIDSTERQWT